MNESLIKYLAGLLDADGSLSLSFKHDPNREGRYFIGLQMRLASSDAVDHHGFVESLPKTYGFGTTTRGGEQAQFITWVVSKRAELEMLLPRFIKHMVIKGKHWQWLLEMWRTARAERPTCSLAEREVLFAASKESRRLNVGSLRPKNHPTWAWVAGYLDGDGCYTHRQNRGHPGYLQWAMNVSAVAHENDIVGLELLQKAFGGQIVGQGQSDVVKLWRRALGYQNRDFALRFLPHIAKHSRLKRHKIDAMIHHHRQRLSVPGVKAQAIV